MLQTIQHINILTGQVFNRPLFLVSELLSYPQNIPSQTIVLLFCENKKCLSITNGVPETMCNAFYFDLIIMDGLPSAVFSKTLNNFFLTWAIGTSQNVFNNQVKNN